MNFIQNNRLRISIASGGLFFILLLSDCIAAASVSQPSESSVILLISPRNHYRLASSTVQFQWLLTNMQDSSKFIPEYYEVMIWSKQREFSFIRTVYPMDSIGARLTVMDAMTRFKRHGRYYWQVQAVSMDGRRIQSEIREFNIPIPKHMQSMMPSLFPYAVKWQQFKRLNQADFKAFMESVYPKTHLQGHSDFCLIFRQPFIGNYNIDLEEQALINSNIGIGGEFSARIHLYENVFFALQPLGTINACWFATGLEKYTSIQYQAYTGVDFIVNPKGYLSADIEWIPVYRLHYALKDDGFRTFEGSGWEWGLKVIVPRNILNPFKLFGIEIDMERMPFEYKYSRITDSYTDVVMHTQEICISFLFQ